VRLKASTRGSFELGALVRVNAPYRSALPKGGNMLFFDRIDAIVREKGSSLCVGLDPYFSLETRRQKGDDTCIRTALDANRRIIEATAAYAACYKPNMAFYEAFGSAGIDLLKKTLEAIPAEIPVLIDAKRGDIDSTAQAYADAVFGELGADAVTLSPYMGIDSVKPFLAWPEKGVFVLCKTSNPSSKQFQELDAGGDALYVRVAKECSSWSNSVGLVVAGNDYDALAKVRAASPRSWFLAPGVGAQGGAADLAVQAGARDDGLGLLVVAARSIANAADPGEAARALRDTIVQAQTTFAAAARRPSHTNASDASHGSISISTAGPHAVQTLQSTEADLKIQLAKALVDTGCFRLGDFVLKSGIHSPFYIDLRRLISKPEALGLAAQAYALLALPLRFDRVAGIPAAGLPLATAACLTMQKPMIWPRMPVKEHGTGNRVEGDFHSGEHILLLDDLITTGESKKEAVTILRSEDLIIEDLIVLIERGKQGRPDMDSIGVRLHAFLHVTELFSYCKDCGIIDAEQASRLRGFVEAE